MFLNFINTRKHNIPNLRYKSVGVFRKAEDTYLTGAQFPCPKFFFRSPCCSFAFIFFILTCYFDNFMFFCCVCVCVFFPVKSHRRFYSFGFPSNPCTFDFHLDKPYGNDDESDSFYGILFCKCIMA